MPVGLHSIDPALTRAMAAVDLDRRIELSRCTTVLACHCQRLAPVVKSLGFVPWQAVLLTYLNRTREVSVRFTKVSVRGGYHSLAAPDRAGVPEPVLSLSKNCAATLQMLNGHFWPTGIDEVRVKGTNWLRG